MHFDREDDDSIMSANLQGDCDRVFADTVGSGDGVDALVRPLAAPDDQLGVVGDVGDGQGLALCL